MCAAVGNLMLLALLAGASADAAEDYAYYDASGDGTTEDYVENYYTEYGEWNGPNDTSPTISATFASRSSSRYYEQQELYSTYGGDVFLYCEANDSSKLTIESNGSCFQPIILDSTTVQLYIGQPNVGDHEFTCTDNSTDRKDSSIITITPKLTVSSASPGFRHKVVIELDETSNYFVPLGQDFEISCSGNDVENLRLSIKGEPSDKILNSLQTDHVNETTTKYNKRAESVGRWELFCHDNITNFSDNAIIVVNFFPEARSFRCISHNGRDLECSWNTLNKDNIFELFMAQHGNSIFLCRDESRQFTRVCNSYKRIDLFRVYYELTLQSCNDVFCNNETFVLYYGDSFLKLDPPSDMRLLNVSSRGATVAWGCNDWKDLGLEYKLEYQLLGAAWQRVNTSALRCDEKDFEFHLNLPCPNGHYKIRLYVKPTAATDDLYWSEPATIFFFTKRQKAGVVVDPECYQKSLERRPLPSAEEMLYEVEQLISYEREKELTLQTQVDTLRLKREKIKMLNEL